MAAFAWTNIQLIATAASANTILQFAVENTPGYFGLDSVSVAPIPAAAFRTAVAATNGLSLSWSTAAGLTYQVQYKTNLAQSSWVNFGTSTVATGSTLTISDTNSINPSSQRFYRLIVSP